MWLDKVQKITQLSLTRGYVLNNNNYKSSNFNPAAIHQQFLYFFSTGKPENFAHSYWPEHYFIVPHASLKGINNF